MKSYLIAILLRASFLASFLAASVHAADIRIGIIGTDTSHVIAFAKAFNDANNPKHLEGARIVAAYKGGSPDVESSSSRVDGYARQLEEKFGVKIVPTIAELAAQVDAIMIESVDGRPHLEEAKAVFPYGKPVFIDKPFGGTLRDVIQIAQLARQAKVPVFSSSSLRYRPSLEQLKGSAYGEVRGAFSSGPAHYEPHHPDLYWYAIHATEALYTIMGTGCESAARTATENTDVVTGLWPGGRVGIVYGIRNAAAPYRVTIFGTKAVLDQQAEPTTTYDGLASVVLEFFRTRISPVSLDETVEIFAFLEAADESKRRGGAPVKLSEVIRSAQTP
jgi:predicted dehydrogenase